MGFHDISFLLSRASFSATFLMNCVGPPHVLKLMLGVSRVCCGFLCNGDHKTATKMRYNLATLSLWDITGFNIVMSDV